MFDLLKAKHKTYLSHNVSLKSQDGIDTQNRPEGLYIVRHVDTGNYQGIHRYLIKQYICLTTFLVLF